MTVREAIKRLSTFDPEAELVVWDDVDGVFKIIDHIYKDTGTKPNVPRKYMVHISPDGPSSVVVLE